MNWSLYSIERTLRNARMANVLNINSFIYNHLFTVIFINLFTQAVLSFIINNIRKEKADGFIN
jgi:hypothetical protein